MKEAFMPVARRCIEVAYSAFQALSEPPVYVNEIVDNKFLHLEFYQSTRLTRILPNGERGRTLKGHTLEMGYNENFEIRRFPFYTKIMDRWGFMPLRNGGAALLKDKGDISCVYMYISSGKGGSISWYYDEGENTNKVGMHFMDGEMDHLFASRMTPHTFMEKREFEPDEPERLERILDSVQPWVENLSVQSKTAVDYELPVLLE